MKEVADLHPESAVPGAPFGKQVHDFFPGFLSCFFVEALLFCLAA
jgi:hypothetical protein